MLLPLATLFGPENWIVIGLVALLLFGRRLPEVGRSLGKGIIEFKKGLAGIEDDISQATTQTTTQVTQSTVARPAALPTGYKFDPYTGKPLMEEPVSNQMKFDPYTGKPLAESAPQSNSSNT
ncbi:MAG: twin-arginine translocase TatA/TatE family subunit [Planctomycetota bacterium]|nr:twin-arginine translocase TatA/TatE family subunit [Planctomycetota bacterium]